MDGRRLKVLGQRDLSVLVNLSPDDDSNDESQMLDDLDVSDDFIELKKIDCIKILTTLFNKYLQN